jgi:hypothetical protein
VHRIHWRWRHSEGRGECARHRHRGEHLGHGGCRSGAAYRLFRIALVLTAISYLTFRLLTPLKAAAGASRNIVAPADCHDLSAELQLDARSHNWYPL